jgi:transposase, IS6 family
MDVGCTSSVPLTIAAPRVDFSLSERRDREAAKRFLQAALANPDNRPPRVFSVDGNRSYGAAIRELRNDSEFATKCRYRRSRYRNNRIESDHRHVKRRWRAMQGARTLATAGRVIEGIQATQMIRKGQVLGIAQHNRQGQVWVFGALLGLE